MYKVIIVDDETSGRNVLEILIERHFPEMEVVGSCDNIEDASNLIMNVRPHIALLDIKMPDGGGFALLSRFKIIPFAVIFVTAHEEFALKALKMSAADYLLKPANRTDLEIAFEKAKLALQQKEHNQSGLQISLQNVFSDEKILVLNKYSGENIPVKDIIYIEADSNYSIIYTNKKSITTSKTLKELDEILCADDQQLIRIHKSYIINFNYLQKVLKGQGQNAVLLSNGKELEVSKRRWSAFKDYLLLYQK